MLIGPIFTRELATAPLRTKFYAFPAIYVGGMLLLLFAAWLLLAGTQELRTAADTARFGMTIFPILALLQLTLALFFAALFAAGTVAQEKDRRTLVLLLLTNLNNAELVLGRLCASLLPLALSLAAAVPFFLLLRGFGGISTQQIVLVVAVSAVTLLTAGSLGSTIALWREKTFLTLALTTLILCAWLGFWTLVGIGALGTAWSGIGAGAWAACFSPLHALWDALQPLAGATRGELPWFGSPVLAYLLFGLVMSAVLNGIAIARLRVWNPPRELPPRPEEEASGFAGTIAATKNIHAAPGKRRTVWDNPIVWREVCTWAYGKRILLVKGAYVLLFAAAVGALVWLARSGALPRDTLAAVLGPLFILSLVLLNALAVNAISNERDLGALDLLLVTDLSPQEFIYGKLQGIFYGAKEMVGLPLLLCGGIWIAGFISGEIACYLFAGLLTLQFFVAMLGVHIGLAYDNSRTAIALSLGTVFFLLVGIGTCMRILIAFSSSSLAIQLMAFSAVIAGGGMALFAALGNRNPSPAIKLTSTLLPIATFVGIMLYLAGGAISVFLWTVLTYGFATLALLIPAIYAFDLATGRTTD